MGGKDAGPTPPPAVQPDAGFDPMMMMQFFASMMSGMGGQEPPPPPQIPDAPEVIADEKIDFSERQTELANQARADYEDDQEDRKGRTDTILTSPLLDEELETKGSLLTNG